MCYEGYIKPPAEVHKMSEMNSLFHLLNKKNVFANLAVNSKKELLNILISSFEEDVSKNELEAIHRAVFQREEMISTGVGNGLAVPHGKSPEIMSQHAALAILNVPVDYNSFDGEPVSVVFLLAEPDSQEHSHLNAMSEISHFMNDQSFIQNLVQQESREELYYFLKNCI